MAKPILKISEKLTKVSESVTVYFYDNAYMVEIAGRDFNEEWATVKLVCTTLEKVLELLQEVETLPKD